MKHAAHKAPGTSIRLSTAGNGRGRRVGAHGAHSMAAAVALSKAQGNGAMVGLEPAVAAKLNEIAPMSRRAMREAARAAERRNILVGSASLAALVGAAASMSLANPDRLPALADDETTTTSQITPIAATGTPAASRDSQRSPLVDANENGQDQPQGATEAPAADSAGWSLGDTNASIDASKLSQALADNPNVAKLVDQDRALLPAGFDPNHDTGDTGCAYEFSQCTWWAYTRRHQLGLPVGSYFGNGQNWAASARAHGYWVDDTPRHVGDIMVFRAGQEGSSPVYGHVAIVEAINADGSITTSECGSSLQGRTISRTFTNVHDFQYIHY